MLCRRTLARYLRWVIISIVALILLLLRGDAFTLSPAQDASSRYTFDLIGWHLTNSMSKWTHLAYRAIPGRAISDAERLALVEEYFRLGRVENDLKDRINVIASENLQWLRKRNVFRQNSSGAHRLRHDIRNDVRRHSNRSSVQ